MTQPDEQPAGRRRFIPSQYSPVPTRDGVRQTHSLLLTLRSKRARYAVAIGAIMVSILVLSQAFLGPHTWRRAPHDVPPFPPPTHNLRPLHDYLPPPGAVDWSRFAYSQYATNSAYLCNTIMIFEALHRLGARADRLLMYPSTMVPDPAGDSNGRLLAKARDVYGVHLVPIAVQHRGGGDREFPLASISVPLLELTDVSRLTSDVVRQLHEAAGVQPDTVRPRPRP